MKAPFDDDGLDWEFRVEPPPLKETGTIRVTFVYAGNARLRDVTPEEEICLDHSD